MPGISAFKTCIDLSSLDIGITAITKASTPIPPIKCEKLLQNNILLLKLSTSSNIVAPVVVKPETDSNKASTKLISNPNQKGKAPNKLINIHDIDTIINPSFAYRVFLLEFEQLNSIPSPKLTHKGTIKLRIFSL